MHLTGEMVGDMADGLYSSRAFAQQMSPWMKQIVRFNGLLTGTHLK